MLRSIILTLFVLGMWGNAQAWQDVVLVRGYVEDAESGERLAGAHVYEWHSGRGTATDNYGYFALQVPADTSLRLRITFLGYQVVWKELPAVPDTFLLIRMQRGEQLPMVVVEAPATDEQATIDRQVMSVEQISRMPMMLGEADVFKALTLLPGVQAGQEGQSAIFVRGGSRDQNLVLLDGVPLYFTNHFAGFFSVFNPDALKQVELYKGGFPAQYGGRLSSVLDLTMKEGHMRQWHAKGAVGLLSGRLAIEGPIVKERASMLLAVRRSWPDLVILPLIYSLGDYAEDERIFFWFGDLNLKLNWIVNDKNRLFVSGYGGRDNYNFDLRETFSSVNFLELGSKTQWDNATLALRWQSLLSDKLTANVVLHALDYDVRLANGYVLRDSMQEIISSFSSTLRTQVLEGGLRASLLYVGLPNHQMRFGASSVLRRLQPFVARIMEDDTLSSFLHSGQLRQGEHALFLSDEWHKGQWTMYAGIRMSGVTGPLLHFWAPEFRLKVSRRLSGARSAWVTFDQMRQYLHLAQSEMIALPTERWLPATRRLTPEFAWQLAVGLVLPQVIGGRLDAGVYYKRMYNLLTWADGVSFVRPSEKWETDVVQGEGEAYGLEWQWTRRNSRWALTLAGNLSRSWRKFDEKNKGKRFPHLFDRPLALNAEVLWHLSERLQLSAFWTLSSGIPQTLIKRKFGVPVDWNIVTEYRSPVGILFPAYETSPINAFRLPMHHRLDLSARWYKKKKRYERWWVLGVYNALLRANVMYLNYDADEGKYVGIGAFPVMPFVAFEFSF